MRFKIFALAAALLLLCGCGGEKTPVQTVDPYEGMVQVESGFGTKMWVELYDDVPVSSFDAADFTESGGLVSYTGSEFDARRGIDVSEHQGAIDWEAVAGDGIDFAMIRAGYRGYSQGGLYTDEYFARNLDWARQVGLDVGLYFFSQAVTPEEAVEEAEFLLDLIDVAGLEISMPIAFDWEHIGNNEARTDDVDGATLTDCAVAFCERVKQAGHDPVVYAYRNLAYFLYDLPRLNDYALWIGALGDSPDFYYKHEIWQYSSEGKVKGIDGPVDLNLFFEEKGDGAALAGGDADGNADADTNADKKARSAPEASTDAASALARADAASTLAGVWAAGTADGPYVWPCASSSRINSKFGYSTDPVFRVDKYHSGVDIDAPEGTEVTAAAGGIVTAAEFDSSYGNYAAIGHEDGSCTAYKHMSKLDVTEGQAVSQGDVIGYVGSTGNADGAHLHFEVWADCACVDPLQYFGGMSFFYSVDA
ncbi:MAG: peptidoglycan DD-metalloendopeptidase family protein [Butyricicoccus sp.]|nr:peptidoglycan DD-metalloendopeptidase family protein [Butyricicoccus sp.]